MNADHSPGYQWPQGGGELGALMRSNVWNSSALGDPREWPADLKSVIELILNSPVPMGVLWGKTRIQTDGLRFVIEMPLRKIELA